jgi:hypothetical protein
MSSSDTYGVPMLFRAGDIGVSSEWRDITYDWAPVLTADGVFIYSYLRDMFDNQRILRPFILDPDGPTKQRIQRVLGRKSAYAIQGPEYLLETVGLLHVEISRGASSDPDRPWHTTTAYYVVGRLDHPVLDWSMLERVLDALMIVLDPPLHDSCNAEQQKKAQAALRSLAQAGMFQDVNPVDLFDPDGAWPSLLPTLIQDERWTSLFVHLHSVEASITYRQQARAWVEWTQRRAARVMQENAAIRDQILAAQRKGPRGGNSGGSNSITIPQQNSPHAKTQTSTPGTPMDNTGATPSITPPEGTEVTSIPSVPDLSLPRPEGIEVNSVPSGTCNKSAQHDVLHQVRASVPDESLAKDLVNSTSRSKEKDIPSSFETSDVMRDIDQQLSALPPVAPYLRDDELASTRHDVHFWQAIQHALHGTDERYAYTEAEKKAAYRLFKRTNTPIGVVLAALRACMTLPVAQRPQSFGEALKLQVFHQCVEQARALLPVHMEAASAGTWHEFLQAYRCIGQATNLRDVSVPEYHVLHALFERQPVACWDALHRAQQAAHPPQLTPAYLQRAIINNQQAAALQLLQPQGGSAACRRSSIDKSAERASATPAMPGAADPRRTLLEQEGVNPNILTDKITVALIQAWMVEADARQEEIKNRAGWLYWGIRSERLPQDHPHLPPRRSTNDQVAYHMQIEHEKDEPKEAMQQLWFTTLRELQRSLTRDEFETWIKATTLLTIEDGQAIVSVPNIFVREEVERRYASLIADVLHSFVGSPVQLTLVINSGISLR